MTKRRRFFGDLTFPLETGTSITSPPFSRVFVAKSRRRRQGYGAFLAPGA